MRREYFLPEEDVEYLDSTGYKWETITEGVTKWLIIHDFPVPQGYNYDKLKVALQIDPGYPVAQIDMVYLNPHLQLQNGKQIGALENHPLEGNIWQRWSRHRTGQNPWRPGIDSIATHMQMVTYWFERELNK